MTHANTNFRSKREFNGKTVLKIANWLVAPAVTAIIVCTVLRFWPNEIVLPKGLKKEQATTLVGQLSGITEMRLGQSATIVLREDDINAYYKFGRAENLELEGFRVKLDKGFMMVRTREKLEWRIGKWVPRLTYDYLCIPYSGKLLVRKASVGHLPLWGPFKNGAVRKIKQMLLDGTEHKLLKHVTDIRIEKDELHISVKK